MEQKETTSRAKGANRFAWRGIGIAAVVVGLVATTRLLPLGEWLANLNFWLNEVGAAGLALFVCIYILATLFFLPGLIFTVSAGFVFGLFWGFVSVSIASTAGAASGFLIGRYLARAKVRNLASRKPKFRAIDYAVAKKGWKIVLLLRLSPVVPFGLQNYVYGLTGITFWTYVFVSWLGMIPGTLLYVYLGAAGRAGVEAAGSGLEADPLEIAFFVVGLIATGAVTVYVTQLARRALREAEADIERAGE